MISVYGKKWNSLRTGHTSSITACFKKGLQKKKKNPINKYRKNRKNKSDTAGPGPGEPINGPRMGETLPGWRPRRSAPRLLLP